MQAYANCLMLVNFKLFLVICVVINWFNHLVVVAKMPFFFLFRFKRSTDASLFIFDVSPSIRKASSETTSAHSKRFWKKILENSFFPKTFRVCACFGRSLPNGVRNVKNKQTCIGRTFESEYVRPDERKLVFYFHFFFLSFFHK